MSFVGHVHALRILFQVNTKNFNFTNIHLNTNQQSRIESARQNHDCDSAYQYICHIEEAKRWMEAILHEELPSTVEFEESLCNGVYLAKLAHFISPETMSLSRIFDPDQRRYKAAGLQFRHTDNINHWLRSLEFIKLPKIFHPVTTDVYEKKNTPRVIYALHALAAHLYLLNKAEKLEVLINKELFSDEDIVKVKTGLNQRGLKVPTFYKIESILEAESRKTSAAAVTDINNALLERNTSKLLHALKNPLIGLHDIDPSLAPNYLSQLQTASNLKKDCSHNQPQAYIVSKGILNLIDIQNAIRLVNVMEIWKKVELAVEQNEEVALLEALESKSLELKAINPNNTHLYLAELSKLIQNPSLKVTSVLDCKIILQKVINAGAYSGFKPHQEQSKTNPGSPRAA